MDDNENQNIAQTVAKLAGGVAKLEPACDQNGDVIPGALVGKLPPEWSTALVDHEGLLGAPRRSRGLYVAHTIASFATLCDGLHSDLVGRQRIYRHATRDPAGAKVDINVTAVLNDDAGGAACWRDLRVRLELLRTPNWLRWVNLFNKPIPQFRLARILEEHGRDIQVPAGADLLKLAMDLEATRSAQFKGTVNLQNRDTGLTFIEKTETTIAVPREIVILLKPYQGHDMEYPVPAFLRYELGDGKVVFTIEPKNWDQWLESMYDDVVKDLMAALPDATWIDGPAPDERRPGE